MGLMCLALTLTNCQKAQIEEVNPSPEANFELFASPAVATDAAITRTTNDGLATKWATGDQINIFHAPAGSTTYTTDKEFTLKDAATGSFGGTVGALDGGSYDWYAFYPYTSQITTPANTSAGWVVVGGKTPQAQIQNGNNSRTHLSRGACPLFGIAKAVESSAVPSIEMNHLTSIIKVQVTNNSSEDLKVENVSFTGTEDIVGTYYINFAASPVGYKPSGNQYVSNTASLEVKNGEVISSGASADFYIAVKPFTAKTGTTLKLAVNGYEKTLTLKNDITFTAGHIKPLNFNYDTSLKTATFNFADPESLGLTKPASGSGTEITASIINGGVTLSETDGSTKTRLWNKSGTCELRSYNGGTLSFSVEEGYIIKTITFAGNSIKAATADVGEYNGGTWQGESASVTFSIGKDGLQINSVIIVYEKGVVLPSLATPEVKALLENINSIAAMWDAVDGAKDYTITCGEQTITTAETKYTFKDLAYSTEYTVSVVANPSDETVNTPSAAGKSEIVRTGANPSGETIVTYQHIFTSKPNVGDNIKLSDVSWKIAASNLGSYNSSSYAGVQFGTKKAAGSITLTASNWSYKEKTKITGVRIWLNAGTGTPTASVNIGGKDAKSDGKVVQKNTNAKTYEDATMLTFTPVDGGDSGIVVIKASTSSKAAYICAMEIDCL